MGSTMLDAAWQIGGVNGADGTLAPSAPSAGDIARYLREQGEPRGIAFDADGDDLASVGWGILFARDSDPAVRRALEPLLDLRRQQAGALYREVVYHGEDSARFRRDLGIAPGPADPKSLPYYLLVVGGPGGIPFELQFDLDLQRAVGRIELATPQAHARYASAVIEAEDHAAEPEGVTLFAVDNSDDPITRSCVEALATPLTAALARRLDRPIRSVLGATATKARLSELLTTCRRSLLFTAGHAVRFPSGHPRQEREQGSLVCADWPGPERWARALPGEFLFGPNDLSEAHRIAGSVAFLHSCYTLGTPRRDLFAKPDEGVSRLAPRPFVNELAKTLLAHPDGPALAVVGHVDQTFEPFWKWPGSESRIETFTSAFLSLLHGHRLGHALEVFAHRYAEIAVELAEREWRRTATPTSEKDHEELGRLWQGFHDARAFGILGDPAVRLGPLRPLEPGRKP